MKSNLRGAPPISKRGVLVGNFEKNSIEVPDPVLWKDEHLRFYMGVPPWGHDLALLLR